MVSRFFDFDRRELRNVLFIWAVLLCCAIAALAVLSANATHIINHIEYVKAPSYERMMALYAEAQKHADNLAVKVDKLNRSAATKQHVPATDSDYVAVTSLYARALALDPREELSGVHKEYFERLAAAHEAVGADAEQVRTLIKALLCAGAYQDAVAYCDILLGRDAKDLVAHQLLVVAQLRKGDPAAAEAALLRFELAGAPPALLHELRGQVALARSDKDTAALEYLAALDKAPDNIRLRLEAGQVLGKLDRKEEAADVLRAGLTRGGNDDPGYLHTLGTALLAVGKNQEAVQVLQRASILARNSADVYWQLARAYARTGQAAKSSQAMAEAMRLNPALRTSVLER